MLRLLKQISGLRKALEGCQIVENSLPTFGFQLILVFVQKILTDYQMMLASKITPEK
jgi:hypothetical protein